MFSHVLDPFPDVIFSIASDLLQFFASILRSFLAPGSCFLVRCGRY